MICSDAFVYFLNRFYLFMISVFFLLSSLTREIIRSSLFRFVYKPPTRLFIAILGCFKLCNSHGFWDTPPYLESRSWAVPSDMCVGSLRSLTPHEPFVFLNVNQEILRNQKACGGDALFLIEINLLQSAAIY